MHNLLYQSELSLDLEEDENYQFHYGLDFRLSWQRKIRRKDFVKVVDHLDFFDAIF